MAMLLARSPLSYRNKETLVPRAVKSCVCLSVNVCVPLLVSVCLYEFLMHFHGKIKATLRVRSYIASSNKMREKAREEKKRSDI